MILAVKSILENDSLAFYFGLLYIYAYIFTMFTYTRTHTYTAYQNMTSILLAIFNEENCGIHDFARFSQRARDA